MEPTTPETPGPRTARINPWMALFVAAGLLAFVFLVPVKDNPQSAAFKQTVWDMIVGNRGTQVIHAR
jgi:hypothetical protein